MGTVVVTGAAGSLAQRVVGLLAARPDVDAVIGIDVIPVNGLPPHAETRILDLARPSAPNRDELEAAMDGADGVIHLAWWTPDDRTAVHHDGAEDNQRALRHVLAAAARTRPASLVHVSSATVYGAWPDNPVPLTEDVPMRPNSEFGFAVGKAEAERVLAEWAEDHPDVAVAVLRPAVTVGSPERPLYQALGGTRAPQADDGGRPVQFLHVDDLAAAVVLAWDRRLSGVYNVAPDNGIREDTARALAGGVAKVALPARVARTVAAWSWQLWRAGVPREAQAYYVHPWVVAADRLKAAGWEPRYTSEEALVATDVRPHWDDLPPGRRQNFALAVVVGGALAAVGSAVGAGWWWRSRRRAKGA